MQVHGPELKQPSKVDGFKTACKQGFASSALASLLHMISNVVKTFAESARIREERRAKLGEWIPTSCRSSANLRSTSQNPLERRALHR